MRALEQIERARAEGVNAGLVNPIEPLVRAFERALLFDRRLHRPQVTVVDRAREPRRFGDQRRRQAAPATAEQIRLRRSQQIATTGVVVGRVRQAADDHDRHARALVADEVGGTGEFVGVERSALHRKLKSVGV